MSTNIKRPKSYKYNQATIDEEKLTCGQITRKSLEKFKRSIHVGEDMIVPMYSTASGTITRKTTTARVVAKYTNFALFMKNINDPERRYCWCVQYFDLMQAANKVIKVFDEEGDNDNE